MVVGLLAADLVTGKGYCINPHPGVSEIVQG